MLALANLIETSHLTMLLVTGLFQFFEIGSGILLSLIIFRGKIKKTVYPYVIVALFCVANAVIYRYDFFLKDDFSYIATAISPLYIFPLSKKSYKYCVVSLLLDLVVGIIGSLFVAVMGNDFQNMPESMSIAYAFVVSEFVFILLLVLGHISAKKSDDESLIARIKLPILFMIVLTIMVFSMTLIHYKINLSTNPRDLYLGIFNISLLVVTIVYTVRSFLKSKVAEEKYKTQLELQIQHFEMLEKKDHEIRIFQHDMPKKLRPLAMYLENKNIEEAKKIVDEFNVSIDKTKSGFNTGNFMLDTVLESEQQIAQKTGASINLVPSSVFPKSGIDSSDIYTIFPNALDNAIEAVSKVDEDRTITFESFIKQGKVYIRISNPFNGTIKERNGKLISTKQDSSKHGYGYSSMKKAAAKYGSDNVSYAVENGMYILTVVLKIPE